MEGIDYSNRLADARSDFQEKIKDMKNRYKTDVENLKENSKYKQAEQAKSYNESKAKLEEQNKVNAEKYAKETQKQIQKKEIEFREKLGDYKGKFENETGKIRQKFADRLTGLINSYNKSSREKERYHDSQMHHNTERLTNIIQNDRDAHEKSIESFQKKMNESSNEMRSRNARDTKQLISKHKDQVEDSIIKNNIEKRQIRDGNQKQIAQMRQTHARERDHMMNHHKNLIAQEKVRHEADSKNNFDNFRTMASSMRERNVAEQERTAKENKENLHKFEKNFDADMNNIRRTASSRIGSLESKLDEEKMHTKRIKDMADRKMEVLKEKLENQQTDSETKLNRAHREFKKNIDDQNVKNMERAEKLEQESHLRNVRMFNKLRMEKDSAAEASALKLNSMESTYERQINAERKQSKLMLTNHQKNHSKTIKTMAEDNSKLVRELQADMAKEKTEFFEKSKREMHKNMHDLRNDLTSKFTEKLKNQEQLLHKKDQEADKLKTIFEEKLSSLEERKSEELKRLRVQEADRRAEDRIMARQTIEAKEKAGQKRYLSLKSRFDREILKIKNENEIRAAKIEQRHQYQLQNLKADMAEKSKRKVQELQAQNQQMREASKRQLDSVRSQYELKIEKLRQANIKREGLRSLRG